MGSLRDLSLSTNGHLLAARAHSLKAAGLDRVNVSLDTLVRGTFSTITGHDALERVLAGIEVANEAGLSPVKVNAVVMRGVNDHEIGALLDYAVANCLELRFIETMPVGTAGAQATDRFFPADEILARVKAHCGADLISVRAGKGSGPARHYQIGSGPARVGVICALSQHFCDGCNRVRLTANGDLILCLDSTKAVPLGGLLRDGADDDAICKVIRAAIKQKPGSHDFFGSRSVPLRAMSTLGG
jgi:cyclic pyranopterin phosphate synthase